MFIKFYGVRGSVPAPISSVMIKSKLKSALMMVKEDDIRDELSIDKFIDRLPFTVNSTYGGNTPCVYLKTKDTHFIFDAGSGIRVLGQDLIKMDFGEGSDIVHLFLSHTHWDHIQGIPFFVNMYLGGNTVNIYSAVKNLKKRLELQHYPQFFPIAFDKLGAKINVYELGEGEEIDINGVTITNMRMYHPNTSFAYRVDDGKSVFIYATDAELNFRKLDFLKKCIEFFKDADVAVIDSQYTLKEAIEKVNWGHSSPINWIDIATEANVKVLILFHLEPTYNDEKIYRNEIEAKRYLEIIKRTSLQIITAYEGLELNI